MAFSGEKDLGVIEAQLEQTAHGAGSRRGSRRTLRLETVGTALAGASVDVIVHNISATGLLFEGGPELAVGDRIEIELPEAGLTEARLIWTSGAIHGCQFDRPISAATLSAAQLRSAVGPTLEGTPAAAAGERLGARLQRLRRARGQTLAQLAATLGVSKPTVWAWEQDRARPLPERTEALAQALGVTPEVLQVEPAGGGALPDRLAALRREIAEVAGADPASVRIMIEL